MKTKQSVQSKNSALATLPATARIQSAKGYINRNGHRMDLSYSVGSTSFRTTIESTGGQSA